MASGLRAYIIQQIRYTVFKLNVTYCGTHRVHTCSVRTSPTDRSSSSFTPENPDDENDETCNTNRPKLKRGLNVGRARRRPTLSVFERVSGMLPTEYTSNLNLENYDNSSPKMGDAIDSSEASDHVSDEHTIETDTTERNTDSYYTVNVPSTSQVEVVVAKQPREDEGIEERHDEETTISRPSEDVPFVEGELVIVTRECHKRQEFLNKMFKLKSSKTFTSHFGAIKHSEIIGNYPGKYFPSTRGHKHYVKRASLDDFTVLMSRTPVISYPRDCVTVCMMIDASPGSKILEAGSGSGGMSLFLSRAVGPTGHVYSFDVKEKHHQKALENFTRWQKSWNLTHEENKWSSNVSFYHQQLEDSEDILGHTLFDGAIIDMEHAYRAMPFVAERLKSGRSVAIFVANITQIIDILEYIRSNNIPLKTEVILEVTHKSWLVAPATRRDGKIIRTYSKAMVDQTEVFDEKELDNGKVVYTARPTINQDPSSAFLLELQKES